jgi:hypothetical protein
VLFRKDSLDIKRILAVLDSRGYSDRMKQMAAWGCEYKGDKAYRDLLVLLLESGSAYEGHLALTGASVTRDAQAILLALSHEKAGVRSRAARLLPEVIGDGASDFPIEAQLDSLSHECRRQLLRSIVIVFRQDWAERLLPHVLARYGGHEAATLLPACSEETVRLRLPELSYALHNWKMITQRYPDTVAVHFQDTLQQASHREKADVWWRFGTAIEMLCTLRPRIVLECALKLGPTSQLHPILRPRLGILMETSPDDVLKLLTNEEARGDLLNHGVPAGVLKRRKLFSIQQWTDLTSLLAQQPLHVAKVLDTLAPSWRGAIFEAAYKEEDRSKRVFPTLLLDVLPHRLRDQEAERMLGLREIQERRESTLEITARREIAQVRATLEGAASVSGAEERAAAYSRLIRSTILSRSGMDETLHFLTRIKNDQDPVRNTVMAELASCPAPLFTEDHIDELTLLADSVIEARDTSYGTRTSIENLAFILLRYHAMQPAGRLFQFALRTFTRMAMRDGQFMLRTMDWESVPDHALNLLADELYALGMEANKRESYTYILRMAGSFGKSVERLPKLQELLKELLQAKTVPSQAVHYWLAPRKTRDERVKELLDKDPSFIYFHEVFTHLHQKRQEWLDPFISGAIIKGRHLSGKTIYLVPASDGFYRWLPRQQKALAVLLEKVSLDVKRNVYERSAAMKSLAKMPDYLSDQLTKLTKDGEVQIAESALHACSLGEQPEKALPILLNNLDSDRARVAMYAIPRCLRRVKPDQAASMLASLLDRDKLKITVRKEAIRLLGAFKSSEGMGLLLRESKKSNVHKDVAIAIGHAARQWLDDERSWDILKEMSLSPERDIVKSLLYQKPGELPDKDRPRYAQWIAEIAGRADGEVAVEAFQALQLWADGNEALLADSAGKAIMDMGNSVSWKVALYTLMFACRDGAINEALIGLCKSLAEKEEELQWNACGERDLPYRQRLLEVIDKAVSLPQHTRQRLLPLYEGMIGALARKESMKPAVIKLHLAMIDWNRADTAIAPLEQVIQIVQGKPHLLNYAYRFIIQAINASKGLWKPEELLGIVDHLKAQTPFEAQYVALPLLQAAGKLLLWNPACAERLRTYRKHEHEAIRLLALDIWTVNE